MVNKKLRPDQDLDWDDLDGESSRKNSKKDKPSMKSLKISDMDDWADSDDGLGSGEDEEEKGSDDDGRRKKGNKDSRKKKEKRKEDVDNETDDKFEDSDDGDDENREVDYITDESSEEEENPEYEQKGNQQTLFLNIDYCIVYFIGYSQTTLLFQSMKLFFNLRS